MADVRRSRTSAEGYKNPVARFGSSDGFYTAERSSCKTKIRSYKYCLCPRRFHSNDAPRLRRISVIKHVGLGMLVTADRSARFNLCDVLKGRNSRAFPQLIVGTDASKRPKMLKSVA